jgi:hypothetical protein
MDVRAYTKRIDAMQKAARGATIVFRDGVIS